MSVEDLFRDMVKDQLPEKATRLERIVCALIVAAGDPFKVDCQSVQEIVRLGRSFETMMDSTMSDFQEVTEPDARHAFPALPIFDSQRVCMNRAHFEQLLMNALDRQSMWHRSGMSKEIMTDRLVRQMEHDFNE